MLEAKNPAKFKEYFSFSDKQGKPNERDELINNNFNSFCNIRVGDYLYHASSFVSFYSEYAFADLEQMLNAINKENGGVEKYWLSNILANENYRNIKKYKERVELACQLD